MACHAANSTLVSMTYKRMNEKPKPTLQIFPKAEQTIEKHSPPLQNIQNKPVEEIRFLAEENKKHRKSSFHLYDTRGKEFFIDYKVPKTSSYQL